MMIYISGIVDRSGIRMFLSPDIRQYDAAGMTIGVNPNPTHIIPPYQKSFVSTSYCNPQCTEKVYIYILLYDKTPK